MATEEPAEAQISAVNASQMEQAQTTPSLLASKGTPSRRTKRSAAYRAGVVFPPVRLQRRLKAMFKGRVAKLAGVYSAAVVEYLSAEVLELAGEVARDAKRKRISPRHLLLALRNDEELNDLTDKVIVPEGGVVPYMHPQLLPTKKKGSLLFKPQENVGF